MIEQPGMHQHSDEPQAPKASSGKHVIIFTLSIIIVLLLAALGFVLWQLKQCNDHEAALTVQLTEQKAKVSDLTKQLTEKSKQATTPSQPAPIAACNPVSASASLKENIHDAISSKNTAALAGYMASSVKVVIAASEKGDTETPDQAVASLDYLKSATSPWDFNLPAATLAAYKAGFYKQYFSDTSYAGKAASDQVVSFDFDCKGKISQIFMAASDDLLK